MILSRVFMLLRLGVVIDRFCICWGCGFLNLGLLLVVVLCVLGVVVRWFDWVGLFVFWFCVELGRLIVIWIVYFWSFLFIFVYVCY